MAMGSLLKKAFTMMEVMVVVIILSVMASFAIPNFTRTIERTHRDDAINQLIAINSANRIYRARNGRYWPPDTSTYNLGQINDNLGLNVIANGMTYTCRGMVAGTDYDCTAIRQPPATSFTIFIDQGELDTNPQNLNVPTSPNCTNNNPCCESGTCP